MILALDPKKVDFVGVRPGKFIYKIGQVNSY